ncbi:type II toxin-antitoxin system HicB family antitoxin [soil metagenome]
MDAIDKVFHFPIIIEQDEDSIYIVSCPSLKGCHAQGKTIEEALRNIEEVIELALEEDDFSQDNRFIGFRELSIKRA